MLRVYLNVEGRPVAPATTFFDATSCAGQAIDLAMAIRRHSRPSYEQVRIYGELAGLRESDLRLWCFSALSRPRSRRLALEAALSTS